MNNIIIGTAGHVDHGKTTLIKALTGVDTDRLKEEKERGITIELGFAYLDLPNGQRCGIIDVPGHERFIRNMLAGANSVDLALFVVAADEGIMPQSREHMEILSLLDIKRGIIAVTKADTVEEEWLDMVVADIKEEFRDTFLKNARIIPVSARTGQGIDKLKQSLFDMIENDCGQQSDLSLFRLPIDRVFSKDGFGTVVTGTITEGEVSVGEELVLYPPMILCKVRTLQVHGASEQTAKKGQRTAINLASIKTDEIKKGCVVAKVNSMQNTNLLDVRLDMTKSTKRAIENNNRVHFYHGTADITAKVVLFGKDEIQKGESCYAQLKLEQPLAARYNDRFVIRFYSPMETIGGGVILDPNPPKRSRVTDIQSLFLAKEKGNLSQRIEAFILDKSKAFPSVSGLRINPFLNDKNFDKEIDDLCANKKIFLIKDSAIHKDYLKVLTKKCTAILNDFHQKNPLLDGIKKEELRSKLLHKNYQQYFDSLIGIMQQEKAVAISGNSVSASNFRIELSDNQKKITSQITQILLSAGYSTPSFDELAQNYSKDQKGFKQSIDALISQGVLIMLTSQILIHKEYFDKAVKAASMIKKEFTLAEFRDMLNTSRKYAVALLEYFDAKQITKKQGEGRIFKEA